MLQLNVEGLTRAKSTIIEHILHTHQTTAILLQETCINDSTRLKIPGFILAAYTENDINGIATFVKNTAKWKAITSSPPDSNVDWAATQIEGVTVCQRLQATYNSAPDKHHPFFQPPRMYAGDFNCRSTTWG